MKKIILSTIFCLGVWVLQGQNLIKTSTESFDKVAIDEILSKRVAVINYEAIEINTDVISNNKAILEFFGHRISVYETKLDVRGLKNYSWFAKSPDGMTSFILTVLGNDIQGMIKSPQGMFIIETIEGQIFIEKINQNIGICGNEIYTDLLSNNYSPVNKPFANNQKNNPPVPCRLRILVLYTQRAEEQSGNIRNTIQLANDQFNLAFRNSGINNIEAELVFVGKTNYEERTGAGSNLLNGIEDVNRFRITNDGHIDEVHQLRLTYSADLCVLIEDIQENPFNLKMLKMV